MTKKKTSFETEKLRELHVSPKTITFIKEALMGVVHDPTGTATKVRIEGLTIGGKTGTAQVVSLRLVPSREEDVPWKYKDHAWFVCLAPVENPEIVVSVFLEHGGHGGSAAGPIAREIVAAYLKPSALKTPIPAAVIQSTETTNEIEED